VDERPRHRQTADETETIGQARATRVQGRRDHRRRTYKVTGMKHAIAIGHRSERDVSVDGRARTSRTTRSARRCARRGSSAWSRRSAAAAVAVATRPHRCRVPVAVDGRHPSAARSPSWSRRATRRRGERRLAIDGAAIGTFRRTAPYQFAWTGAAGDHTLVATASDARGNVASGHRPTVTVPATGSGGGEGGGGGNGAQPGGGAGSTVVQLDAGLGAGRGLLPIGLAVLIALRREVGDGP